jgi:FkbH-like protein
LRLYGVKVDCHKKIRMYRWALVSNTTIAPLVPRLRQAVRRCGVDCEFFVVEHGDSDSQIFSPGSQLYAFRPDLIVLYLDLEQLKPRFELSVAFETSENREVLISEVLREVTGRAKALRNNTSAVLLTNSFPVQPRTVLGIGLDQVYKNALRELNLRLYQAVSMLQESHVFDCDSLWAEVGFGEYDRRFEMIAQFPFGVRMQQALVDEWIRYFRALKGLTRKCIVVDLDNTLWGGVLGEDGPDGIRMGDTPEGRPFRRFQQALKALNRRGLLLAISSKNNIGDVKAVLQVHPDMVLRESDFAAMQINWEDKATNLACIARELNIGLQHLVFLDDNPAERAWVRERHPEVLVPEMPQEQARYVETLCHCETDALAVTEEDLQRPRMYREERQRREFQAEAPSFEHFLNSLGLEVNIEPVRPALLERAAQLCQRTNQFNLTTCRHNAEMLTQLSASRVSAVLLMQVHDRFGDYGWSGLAIVNIENTTALIDTFLLSCRVMGKNAEFALFAAVVKWARNNSCTHIKGFYLPTSKNPPCKDFLERCGLKAAASQVVEPGQAYEANLAELQMHPIDHIKISMRL